MHQSSKYGYLLINGFIPPIKVVKHLLRLHHKTYDKTLKELLKNGVLKEDKDGVIYCERMVKDEYIRTVRREAGAKGNAVLRTQKASQKGTQNTPPSSSSSFSPSSSINTKKKIYKRKKNPSQTQAPSFFPVTDQMRKYAEQKNYIADLEDLTEAFLLHHKSKGSFFVCWYSAWQKWLRNQLDWYPERNVPKGQSPNLNLQPQTYAQAQDAERRDRNKWLLKEMENEKHDSQNHSAGAPKVISKLPKSKV